MPNQETILRGLRRIAASNLQKEKATDAERAALAQAGLSDPIAQDYAVWRCAVLWAAAILLGIGFVLELIGHESLEDGDCGAQLVQLFGKDNLETLDTISLLSIMSAGAAAAFAGLAARGWKDLRYSRKMSRWGWLILFGVPLLIAIFPWARVLDFGHMDHAAAVKVRGLLGMLLGLEMFMILGPKLVAIFPGVIRAAMTIKTLLHESAVPGYLTVIFAPVFMILVLMLFSALNQMYGDLNLLIGLACLICAAGVYVFRAKNLVRSHTLEEVETIIVGARKASGVFTAVGVVLLAIFMFGLEIVETVTVFQFFILAAGGLLLAMAVGGDFVIAILSGEHVQAKKFQSSEEIRAYESKIDSLATTGLTSFRDPKPAAGGSRS
jgi:hypothetical protein